LVEKFRINTEKLFGEMQAELKKNNADGVRLVGHTLKGSSRSMGATRLGDLWEQMEKMAVKNELSEIPALADEIKNEIGKTFASFERFLSTDKAA
jgi:HPt (histidine-containing phosphotransfer) domain-containing protein